MWIFHLIPVFRAHITPVGAMIRLPNDCLCSISKPSAFVSMNMRRLPIGTAGHKLEI